MKRSLIEKLIIENNQSLIDGESVCYKNEDGEQKQLYIDIDGNYVTEDFH